MLRCDLGGKQSAAAGAPQALGGFSIAELGLMGGGWLEAIPFPRFLDPYFHGRKN